MSTYKDIASYGLAVLVRSRKTILVEGSSDKAILSHFILSRNYDACHHADYFVDEVSMIKQDPSLTGMGNKQKVLTIASRLNPAKLGAVVDREWDSINLDNLKPESFSQNKPGIYVTKGHSIENYWFDADAAISFLISAFPTIANQNFLNQINTRFPAILRFAAAYSVSAKESFAITRLSDLLTAQDLVWSGSEYRIDPNFEQKAQSRGISGNFCEKINSKAHANISSDQSLLKWVCHGHLGEEAIRCCIASTGLACGISATSAQDIERGRKTEKLSHDSNYMCKQDDSHLEPLPKLLEWLRSPNP